MLSLKLPVSVNAQTLAIAVSGGADSLALTLLAKDLADAQGGQIIALSVDHHLRAESGDELEQLAGWLAEHGIEHHILHWREHPASGNLQEAAREARYGLMRDFCEQHDITYLLTAHHRDDQIETIMYRIWRGAGVEGLSGMPAMRPLSQHVQLMRPLLDVPKAQLIEYLKQRGQEWIEDPSNDSDRFARTRIRTVRASWPDAQLDQKLLQLAGQMRLAADTIAERVESFIEAEVSMTHGVVAEIQAGAFARVDAQIGLRALAHLLQLIGRQRSVRYEKLVRAYKLLCGEGYHNRSPSSRTLGFLSEQRSLRKTYDPGSRATIRMHPSIGLRLRSGPALTKTKYSLHEKSFFNVRDDDISASQPSRKNIQATLGHCLILQPESKKYNGTIFICREMEYITEPVLGAEGIKALRQAGTELPNWPALCLQSLPARVKENH